MRTFRYLLAVWAAVALSACGARQGRTETGSYVVSGGEGTAVSPQEIVSMPPVSEEHEATIDKHVYHAKIERRADESLPVVAVAGGVRYYDNRVVLTVRRDGKEILAKELTKGLFAPHLDSAFIRQAVFEGLVFDRVSPHGLLFAASVGQPEDDLYVPFRVAVDAGGQMSIEKSDLMDDEEEETAGH